MAIISLSGGAYSGIDALAGRLSEELGYQQLSREELLNDAAEEFGLSENQLKSAFQHMPGFLEGRGLKRRNYIHCVQATIAKAVQSDNVVYHGQAGHLLLKAIPHHLRVRVVADVEHRIAAVMQGCDLTRDKAIEYIRKWDEKRDHWVRWVHGVDADDPTTYDLVVNLERIPLPSACAVLIQAADRDFRTTPQSQRTLDDLVIASQIRARIGLDPGIPDDRIDVQVNDGVVSIAASVRYQPDAEKVRELAGRIPGVRRSETKIEA